MREVLPTRPITFVVSVNDREIFENNFIVSPCLRKPHPHQILVQEGFRSAAASYNEAIDRSINDLMVFAHQDIILTAAWLSDLERSLRLLELTDPNWGVLGCYGVTSDSEGRGYIYSPWRGIAGCPFEYPVEIKVLDEIVLILRKSSGLRFDKDLPYFHLYGTDICCRAAKKGKKSYAISTLCAHNARDYVVLPKEFYACYRHIKKTWRDFLPIQTTCIRITAFDVPMYTRRLRELYLRHVRHKR